MQSLHACARVVILAIFFQTQLPQQDASPPRVRLAAELLKYRHDIESTPANEYATKRAGLLKAFEETVNQYLESMGAESDNPGSVRAGLIEVLGASGPSNSFDGYNLLPYVSQTTINDKKFLIVQFAGPPPDSRNVLAAYEQLPSSLKAVAFADYDFDQFAVTTVPIATPVRNEQWYLLSGPKFNFNGTLVRIRIYAFDGRQWRKVWAPADVLNGRIETTANRIYVTSRDANRFYKIGTPPFGRRDTYSMGPDGIKAIASELVSED